MEFDVISFGIGLFVGLIVLYFVREAYLERKISRLERENKELDEEVYSYEQRDRNTKGLESKRDKAERMQSAMLEFAAAMKEGVPLQDVLKALAAKYPDIAMDLVKKGMKV